MKYINIGNLADGQYEDLSNFIENSLAIYDEDGQQIEYDVTDLKVDEVGIVYAPTEAKTHQEVSNSGDDIPGGRNEIITELTNYQPTKFIVKNQ